MVPKPSRLGAYPRTEEEVAAVLDWAGGAQASVTPFGGGSSVVGGVEPQRDAARHKGALTIDLRELGRVLEVDKISRAARIEAGAFGPALEAQLKPHGLTLRHFPQSFECSTLGGWIATGGGHCRKRVRGGETGGGRGGEGEGGRRGSAVCRFFYRGQSFAGDLASRIISGQLPYPRPAGSVQHRRCRRQRGALGVGL